MIDFSYWEQMANSSDPDDVQKACNFFMGELFKHTGKLKGNNTRAIIKSFSDIPPEKPTWLWEGHIPRGMFTIIGGDPGQGKSSVALDIAARVSTGRPFIHSLFPIGTN
jgi:hypothetical protein